MCLCVHVYVCVSVCMHSYSLSDFHKKLGVLLGRFILGTFFFEVIMYHVSNLIEQRVETRMI